MSKKFSDTEVERWAKMVDVTDGMSREDVIEQVRGMVGTPGLAEAVADSLVGGGTGGDSPRKKEEKAPVPDDPIETYHVVFDLFQPGIKLSTEKADKKTVFASFRSARSALLLWLRLERNKISALRKTIRTWKTVQK